MPRPDVQFWQDRFATGRTPWDRGEANPQMAAWIAEGVFGSGADIIVPGCGSGHELPLLAACGCHVTAIDYSSVAVALARAALDGAAGAVKVVQADVLCWQPHAAADVVYEQTCLCALHPDQWIAYAQQVERWLKPGGRLAALFMQSRKESAAQGYVAGPPYHCDIHAMRALFAGDRWDWPAPPYRRVPHPIGSEELGVVLMRR